MEPARESHRCPKCSGEFFAVEKKKTVDDGEWSRQKYYKAARDSFEMHRVEQRGGYRF